jgi:hypothetical protein
VPNLAALPGVLPHGWALVTPGPGPEWSQERRSGWQRELRRTIALTDHGRARLADVPVLRHRFRMNARRLAEQILDLLRADVPDAADDDGLEPSWPINFATTTAGHVNLFPADGQLSENVAAELREDF